jgi:hypothetical protein
VKGPGLVELLYVVKDHKGYPRQKLARPCLKNKLKANGLWIRPKRRSEALMSKLQYQTQKNAKHKTRTRIILPKCATYSLLESKVIYNLLSAKTLFIFHFSQQLNKMRKLDSDLFNFKVILKMYNLNLTIAEKTLIFSNYLLPLARINSLLKTGILPHLHLREFII